MHLPIATTALRRFFATELSSLTSTQQRAIRFFACPGFLLALPTVAPTFAPIVYAIPAQLLAYHTALAKGTDVDQPRNLAKSVTVE